MPPHSGVSPSPRGGGYDLTIHTDAYARAVELLPPPTAVPDDNYFDLPPDESRTVHIRSRQRLGLEDIDAECW